MRRVKSLLFLVLTAMNVWAVSLPVKVGVLLPLKAEGDFGRTMVEFYRGLLMSVEELKREGVSVDVVALEPGQGAEGMAQVLQNPALAGMNVVFGPVDAAQVSTLAEFCRRQGTRMVLPFNTPCPQIYSNPNIYQTGVALEMLYPGVTQLVMQELEDSHFVFYRSGEVDARAQGFTEHLAQVLALRGMQSAVVDAQGGDEALLAGLNQFRRNVVVIDDRALVSLSALVVRLKALRERHPEYKVALLGYPDWLTYTGIMLKDFYQMDTYVFSSYFRNPLSGRVAKFEQQYLRNFRQAGRNSFPRAEMLGYDLGIYFLRGLSQLGAGFDEAQGTLHQQPLQHTFNFQRQGTQGGYSNLFSELVHYTTFSTIQEIR